MTNELIEELKECSIVPVNYKEKDPRKALYLYPSMPVVWYAKKMQVYSFNQALEVAEDMAHKLGYVLLPSVCIHWQRVQKIGQDRRVKIGKYSYYLMRLNEMTKTEASKLQNYIEEMTENDNKYN